MNENFASNSNKMTVNETDKLLNGKLPFFLRYGITSIFLFSLISIYFLLSFQAKSKKYVEVIIKPNEPVNISIFKNVDKMYLPFGFDVSPNEIIASYKSEDYKLRSRINLIKSSLILEPSNTLDNNLQERIRLITKLIINDSIINSACKNEVNELYKISRDLNKLNANYSVVKKQITIIEKGIKFIENNLLDFVNQPQKLEELIQYKCKSLNNLEIEKIKISELESRFIKLNNIIFSSIEKLNRKNLIISKVHGFVSRYKFSNRNNIEFCVIPNNQQFYGVAIITKGQLKDILERDIKGLVIESKVGLKNCKVISRIYQIKRVGFGNYYIVKLKFPYGLQMKCWMRNQYTNYNKGIIMLQSEELYFNNLVSQILFNFLKYFTIK